RDGRAEAPGARPAPRVGPRAHEYEGAPDARGGRDLLAGAPALFHSPRLTAALRRDVGDVADLRALPDGARDRAETPEAGRAAGRPGPGAPGAPLSLGQPVPPRAARRVLRARPRGRASLRCRQLPGARGGLRRARSQGVRDRGARVLAVAAGLPGPGARG